MGVRRMLLGVCLALAAFAVAPSVWGQSAKTELRDPVLATRFNEVSDALVCQCGCQMILRVCNHQNCPSAIPMRHEIEKQLQAGKTNDEIIASFVAQYGDKVLSEPPATGFNLAAYVMPGFGLLVGLFIVATIASRWMSRHRLAVEPAAPVDPELRKRIEKEIKAE
ncbi:MAG TPA: cytochrome c-type biogenesis protein [Candidatus Krumholzibacteria bacterium]|nr:cytochrome c-type biogenesis protein [Candidatus Krumholzibacteria bacterium]